METAGEPTFGIVDYCVFVAVLAISAAIGVYASLKGNKSPEEFFMGNRAFGPIPVGMSLLTSYISAISILGLSGEAYAHGIQLFIFVIGVIFGIGAAGLIILPLMHPLKLISVNEYLELRFKSSWLRKTITIICCIKELIFMGICLYAPTLALASVTPLSSLTYIFILGIAVTIYSSTGGIRAVVWTDVFQLTVMSIGLFVIVGVGLNEVGGPTKVWNTALAGGRLDIFNTNPSLYERHNIYNTFSFGFFTYSSLYGVSQINIQRICSVPTVQDAVKVLWINAIGMLVINILIFGGGVIAYAAYADCDPWLRGVIEKKDEIVPHYIVNRLSFVTGLPGVFVATLIGGTLSAGATMLLFNAVDREGLLSSQDVTNICQAGQNDTLDRNTYEITRSELERVIESFRNSFEESQIADEDLSMGVEVLLDTRSNECQVVEEVISLSSVMNAQVAMIWKDCCSKMKIFADVKPTTAGVINKIFSFVIGVAVIGSAVLSSKATSVVQFSITLSGIMLGPIYGVFLLGILFPKTNLKGVWTGLFVSVVIVSWVSSGAFLYGKPAKPLPFSVEECPSVNLNGSEFENGNTSYHVYSEKIENSTQTNFELQRDSEDDFLLMKLYGISYTLYGCIGTCSCILIGVIVSFFTGNQDLKDVSPKHVSPVVRKFYWDKKDLEMAEFEEHTSFNLQNVDENMRKPDFTSVQNNGSK